MIKVIYVLTDKNIGGAGRWLLSQLRFMDTKRYEISVLLPENSLLTKAVKELGFTAVELPGMQDSSWDKGSLGAMTDFFRAEKPQIVHVGASLTARIAAKRAGVPVLVMTKHCAASRGGFVSRMAHAVLDRALTDKIIAVSSAVGEQLAAAGTPKSCIEVIPNGITPVVPYGDVEREELRERFGFDKEFLWVGVAARLEQVKGVDLFLDAAREVLSRRDDVRFAVFGIGSQEEPLRARVADLGDKVRFCGFCKEIEQALFLLDIAVVPSRSEAFCLSAAEAMSMGTPVVAFDVDGVGEVVRDGETGLLAPAGNAAALAGKIEILLSDEALRQRFGERGREVVRAELTAETMVQKTQALYERLLEKKGVGAR